MTSPQARALNFYTPGGFDDQFSYLATPAKQKTVPPEDLPAVDPAQKDAYLNRLRDLHQETMLSDEQTW